MKSIKLSLLTLLLFVLSVVPLFANSQSTRFSTVKPMYSNETLVINAGRDIEGYAYMGMIIGRKESSSPNATVPTDYKQSGAYTKAVEVDGNLMWFISSNSVKTSGSTRFFELKFNTPEVANALFSIAPTLSDMKISNTLNKDSRVFALEWYHVYRTPEGRIVAVGEDFTEYSRPYRTFIKLGPQVLSIDVETGSHDYESTVNTKIVFSDPVDVKGGFDLKFKGFPDTISFNETFNEKSVRAVSGTFKFPAGFPQLDRGYALTLDNLHNSSAKTEGLSLTGSGRTILSTITNLPPSSIAPHAIASGVATQLNAFEHIGDNVDNSIIVDHKEPTIEMKKMSLTKKGGVALPEQSFDSTGNAINPVWFNDTIVGILGTYTDAGAGPGTLSIYGPDMTLLKLGNIPNNVLVTPKLPPYRIGAQAIIDNQRANINLPARTIRDAITSETLFEDEVSLFAKVRDMVAFDRESKVHEAIKGFKAYIDLYPPEIESVVIQASGERNLKFTSNNAKITQIEFIFMNQKPYRDSMESGKWEDVPEFYLYTDGYNHGADTLEAFVNHLVGGMSKYPAGTFTTKVTENLATPDNKFEKTYTGIGGKEHAWIAYRTVDELGNVGYGHTKGTVIERGAPFLVEIDTPQVEQYFSNLPETKNSNINLKARVIDMALADDEVMEVNLTFSMYRKSAPNTPIAGMENIQLGTMSLTGPKWYEFNYDIDLKNYVTNPTDLDGELILEVKANQVIDYTVQSVPARVPIIVHSKIPSLTHKLSETLVAGKKYPNLTVDTTVTSDIPLHGVYNATTLDATFPTFVFGDDKANSSWKKIESTHSEILNNLNGDIYYYVTAYDKAKNKVNLKVGPISMYSDLSSYIYSTKSSAFVGNRTSTSTPTLILTNTVDNSLIHNTELNSAVQLPLLNLKVKLTESGTDRVINSGSSTSTTLELPFIARNKELDYKKYLAEYELTSGVPVQTPAGNSTAEVYTIINPIQNIFDISLNFNGTQLQASAKLKTDLNTVQFSNGETLQQVVQNAKTKFGIDLVNDLKINVNAPVGDASAKPLGTSNVTIPMTNSDYIVIGYPGKGNSPDYELKFNWDTSLANAQITNVPSALVQAHSSYEIQLKATHLGQHYTLPANLTDKYKKEFVTKIMIIPQSDGLYNSAQTPKENWQRLETLYAKDYTVQENRTIRKNGKYDILVEVTTPFKIKCYDYKQLNLLLSDKEDYLASENNQSLLISSSTVFNSLNNRLANHSIKATKASDVGAYQLQNGHILVFSKIPQTGANTVLEVYDAEFNLVKKLDATSTAPINQVHDVTQAKNLTLLGTNAGLFSITEDYSTLTRKNITGSTLTDATTIYQLEGYNDAILVGADDVNTLQLVNVVGDDLIYNSSKTATDLFMNDSKRVRRIQVRNSHIYVTYDAESSNAVKYTVLE